MFRNVVQAKILLQFFIVQPTPAVHKIEHVLQEGVSVNDWLGSCLRVELVK